MAVDLNIQFFLNRGETGLVEIADYGALRAIIVSVRTPSFCPILLRFSVDEEDVTGNRGRYPVHRIHVQAETRDRDTGDPTRIVLSRKIPLPISVEAVLEECRMLAQEVFAHECDEFLQVGGRRLWDPHKDEEHDASER